MFHVFRKFFATQFGVSSMNTAQIGLAMWLWVNIRIPCPEGQATWWIKGSRFWPIHVRKPSPSDPCSAPHGSGFLGRKEFRTPRRAKGGELARAAAWAAQGGGVSRGRTAREAPKSPGCVRTL